MRALRQLGTGSDRLTNAVRAYAATGDRRYYDEFQRELNVDRTRDAAVEQLAQIDLTGDERSLLAQAKRNSDQLVGLERRAFDAVERKDYPAAIALGLRRRVSQRQGVDHGRRSPSARGCSTCD